MRGGLGGAGGATGGPTTASNFDDDFDDDDDDFASPSSTTSSRKVNVSLPTFAPFEDSDEDTNAGNNIGGSDSSTADSSPSRINLLAPSSTASEPDTDSTAASDTNSIRRR